MASDSYDHLFKVGLRAVFPCSIHSSCCPNVFHNSGHACTQVLLVGDSAVGKSCLLMRFTADRFDEVTTSTIGMAAGRSGHRCTSRSSSSSVPQGSMRHQASVLIAHSRKWQVDIAVKLMRCQMGRCYC
jgi:hypothetical protein